VSHFTSIHPIYIYIYIGYMSHFTFKPSLRNSLHVPETEFLIHYYKPYKDMT